MDWGLSFLSCVLRSATSGSSAPKCRYQPQVNTVLNTLWIILEGRAAGPFKIDSPCLRSGPSSIQEFEVPLIDKGLSFTCEFQLFPTTACLSDSLACSDLFGSAIAAATRSSQGKQRGGKQRQQTACTGGMWMVRSATRVGCITSSSWRDSVPLLRVYLDTRMVRK